VSRRESESRKAEYLKELERVGIETDDTFGRVLAIRIVVASLALAIAITVAASVWLFM
jgi:hypothetical protein